jgi:cytochrome P450
MLPEYLVAFFMPATEGLQEFQDAMKTIIRHAKQDVAGAHHEPSITVMHGILTSELPPSEKSERVLVDQAAGLVAAGIVSTRWTLTLACYHLVSQKDIWETLRRELEQANPSPDESIALSQLEQLPYLTACVEEGSSHYMFFFYVTGNSVF